MLNKVKDVFLEGAYPAVLGVGIAYFNGLPLVTCPLTFFVASAAGKAIAHLADRFKPMTGLNPLAWRVCNILCATDILCIISVLFIGIFGTINPLSAVILELLLLVNLQIHAKPYIRYMGYGTKGYGGLNYFKEIGYPLT